MGTLLPPVKTQDLRNVSATHLCDTCCAFTGRADAYVPCLSKIHCSQRQKGEKNASLMHIGIGELLLKLHK